MDSEKNSENTAGHSQLLKYIKFIYCQNVLSPPQNIGQTSGACLEKKKKLHLNEKHPY